MAENTSGASAPPAAISATSRSARLLPGPFPQRVVGLRVGDGGGRQLSESSDALLDVAGERFVPGGAEQADAPHTPAQRDGDTDTPAQILATCRAADRFPQGPSVRTETQRATAVAHRSDLVVEFQSSADCGLVHRLRCGEQHRRVAGLEAQRQADVDARELRDHLIDHRDEVSLRPAAGDLGRDASEGGLPLAIRAASARDGTTAVGVLSVGVGE